MAITVPRRLKAIMKESMVLVFGALRELQHKWMEELISVLMTKSFMQKSYYHLVLSMWGID